MAFCHAPSPPAADPRECGAAENPKAVACLAIRVGHPPFCHAPFANGAKGCGTHKFRGRITRRVNENSSALEGYCSGPMGTRICCEFIQSPAMWASASLVIRRLTSFRF